MRTAHLLTVSQDALGGGCLPRVCVCVPGGVFARGVCAAVADTPPRGQNDRQV